LALVCCIHQTCTLFNKFNKKSIFIKVADIKFAKEEYHFLETDTILKDCTGDLYSFASQGFIEGNLYGCRLTSGSFNTLNIQGSGSITLGIDGDNNVITQP
jgi:hypothetical protein